MSSPLFRKLLFTTVGLIAATVLLLDYFITGLVSDRETQTVQHRLESEARILAVEIASGLVPPVDQALARMEQRSRARITIIGRNGAVFADSQHDAATMENHASRPEVLQALSGKTGAAVRQSATIGRDLCYVALPPERAPFGDFILRLAVPLEEIRQSVSAIRKRLYGISLLTALAAMVTAYLFSARFTGRVNALQQFSGRLSEGHFPASLTDPASDELGQLAKSLNRMATRLHEAMDRLSLESSNRDAILRAMVEGVLALDKQLRVTFCNEAFLRIAGAGETAPIGQSLVSVVRDPELSRIVEQAISKGATVRKRLLLSGDRSFEVTAGPLAGGAGVLVLFYEVTALERLERMRRDLVANVSHELRTPLTAIQGCAETLLDGAIEHPDHSRRFVEIIRSHSERLGNIASDLLVLSEIETGSERRPPELVSVPDAIQAAVNTVEPHARDRNIDLRLNAIPPANIRGYRVRLEQALVNLLDNAIKFNRPGGFVQAEAHVEGRWVRISVADNGVGIPALDQPRVFERFYRVDKSRSREVGGTGLGLAIVKHAAESMGGRVTLESAVGRGSKFSLHLPLAPAGPDQA